MRGPAVRAKLDTDAIAFLIPDCARLMRFAFEKRIFAAGLGLSVGEARTLIAIATANGCRQMDIASRMAVEPMTVSGFLDKLQARGLIQRVADPLDRRAKRITLSETADDLIVALNIQISANQDVATSGLDTDVKAQAVQGLKTIRNNLQKSG